MRIITVYKYGKYYRVEILQAKANGRWRRVKRLYRWKGWNTAVLLEKVMDTSTTLGLPIHAKVCAGDLVSELVIRRLRES